MQALSYTATAKALHWLMAGLIFTGAAIGLSHAYMSTGAMLFWLNVHYAIGLCVIALSILRLAWRATHAVPPLPATIAALLRHLAHGTHLVLYGLMVVVPMSGALSYFARGKAMDLGLFQIPPLLARNPHLASTMLQVHGWLAYGFIAAIGAHIGAALLHQFVLGDEILSRMLPKGFIRLPPLPRRAKATD
ncbi:cytochrome b [Methylovirgula sp. 4M-Z18]|uniref:cytochrome b n=1 Tax=Methylovirgula sp. 4M-Z18 TaxID=2293567 RepID=UPI0013146CCB|nr:cytochrome b/b6 domain-containing protein [Methylovirgula sp. 4M-Z18]